jgi:hypothetical protein
LRNLFTPPVPLTMRIPNSDVLLRKYYPASLIVAAGRVLARVNPWDERTGAVCFVGEVRFDELSEDCL